MAGRFNFFNLVTDLLHWLMELTVENVLPQLVTLNFFTLKTEGHGLLMLLKSQHSEDHVWRVPSSRPI